MKKYGYHGTLKAKEGKGPELAEILLQSASGNMPGCHSYIVAQDMNNEDILHISEVWETKDAHVNSLKVESVKAAISKAIPLLDGMPQKGTETWVLGGKGI